MQKVCRECTVHTAQYILHTTHCTGQSAGHLHTGDDVEFQSQFMCTVCTIHDTLHCTILYYINYTLYLHAGDNREVEVGVPVHVGHGANLGQGEIEQGHVDI